MAFAISSRPGGCIQRDALEAAHDQSFDPADGRKVLLNRVADLSSAVFGEMCLMQNHDSQAPFELKTSTGPAVEFNDGRDIHSQREGCAEGIAIRAGGGLLARYRQSRFLRENPRHDGEIYSLVHRLAAQDTNFHHPCVGGVKLQAEFYKSQLAGDIGDIRSLRMSGKAAPHLTVVPPQEKIGRVVRTSWTRRSTLA
jgi:hypothetical protein